VKPAEPLVPVQKKDEPKKDEKQAEKKDDKKKEEKAGPTDEQLIKEIKVPEGFTAKVFVAPPQVGYPVGLCVAPNGDVYIASDENGSLGANANRGKIFRCVDTNNDGRADKIDVFATIDSPRGLFHDGKQLFVLAPPNLVSFTDTDGDGKSDKQETLVAGIGFDLKFRGADHTTNQLQMGADGWIYVAVGDYGFRKATDKSGKTLEYRGGGIVRVKPDGTNLEVVSRGQRNIYDVAISPRGELFTRDNTNDGGGWNVRLSHVLPGAQMGYPSHFLNFPAEHWPALVDYGGGSPCGSLYMDEPGLPPEIGRTLLTCDWGRSVIYRHPLKADGASFTPEAADFLKISRPVDIDYDGAGKFYVASWRDGGFSYSHPFVGYIAVIEHTAGKYQPLPDVAKLDVKQLLAELRSDSHRRRLFAQLELQRRLYGETKAEVANVPAGKEAPGMMMEGMKSETITKLTDLFFDSKASLESRLAVVPLLNEHLKNANEQECQDLLARFETEILAKNDPGAVAIPALLAQSPLCSSGHTPIIYKALLTHDDPRVRLQAVSIAGKIPQSPLLLRMLLSRLTDDDRAVAHIGERSLLGLAGYPKAQSGNEHPQNTEKQNPELPGKVADTISLGLTDENPKLSAAAARILGQVNRPAVVTDLIQTLGKKSLATEQRQAILTALCRQYFVDQDWDGKWWGTRPDTTGPYYTPVKWSESDRLAETIKQQLISLPDSDRKHLLTQALKHKIDLPEVIAAAQEAAVADADFRKTMLPILANRKELSANDVKVLELAARDEQLAASLRAKAISSLCRDKVDSPAFVAGFTALVDVLGKDKPAKELTDTRDQVLRDSKNFKQYRQILARLKTDNRLERELLFAMVLPLLSDPKFIPKEKAELEARVNKAWDNPQESVDLLKAVSRSKAEALSDAVRTHVTSTDKDVQVAAKDAFKALQLDKKPDAGPKIAKLAFDDVLAEAKKLPGDVARGEQLFTKQQCVNCHTVNKSETPKGPFLGGISARYNRAELTESILKPSAKIAQGFETQWFETDDGKTFEGFVSRESGTEVEIRNVKGEQQIISKEHLEERGKREQSIMPNGLLDNVTPADLASLLKYLESLPAN
jgi:putative membrane-bound dehydrogenase-like protein